MQSQINMEYNFIKWFISAQKRASSPLAICSAFSEHSGGWAVLDTLD